MTAGTAPHFSVSIDPTTNRFSGAGYDAGPPLFDVENRIVPEISGTNVYDPAGKRLAVGVISGQPNQFYFYSITGQRLGTYALSTDGTTFTMNSLNVYFGRKLVHTVTPGGSGTVATDRLGSVRGIWTGSVERMAFWPYGQKRTSTPDWQDKFATYFRDSQASVALDYADQRYYSYIYGRFRTPDPAGLKAVNLKNPISWNRYAYVNDDPINLNDPSGLVVQCDSQGNCVDTGIVTTTITVNGDELVDPLGQIYGPEPGVSPGGDTRGTYTISTPRCGILIFQVYASADIPASCWNTPSSTPATPPSSANNGSADPTVDNNANALAQAINQTGVQSLANPCTIAIFYGASAGAAAIASAGANSTAVVAGLQTYGVPASGGRRPDDHRPTQPA